MNLFSSKLKDFIINLEADLVGFASLIEIPYDNRWGHEFGISIAVAYKPKTLLKITDMPNDKYYLYYEQNIILKMGYTIQ